MEITVRLYGDLIQHATSEPPAIWFGNVNEPATVRDVIDAVGCDPYKVFSVIRNSLYIEREEAVANGDLLHFLTRLGGG